MNDKQPRVLIDSNVILDDILQREPFYKDAQKLMAAAKTKLFIGYVSASAITDIYYISTKCLGSAALSMDKVRHLLNIVLRAPIDDTIIRQAANIEWSDFEDAVQYTAAEQIGADYIITRNSADFAESLLPVLSPAEILALITDEKR